MKFPLAFTTRLFRFQNVAVFLFWFCVSAQETFTKDQILSDMAYLKSTMEEAHYNLYAYTPKKEFDRNYEEIKQSVRKDSFNLLEATSLLQRIISKANNGHTEIGFPGQSYGTYAYAGGTIFPLEITFEDGKGWIRKNWSGNDSIKVGLEILAINGQSMEQILAKIYPQLSAERPYFKNAKIELYSLPRLYWQVYGQIDSFTVELVCEGKPTKFTLKAVDVIDGYEMKRNEVIDSKMQLKFMGESAYLNPGGFGGDEAKYQQFIDSCFTQIKAQKSKNLIIDLRNNPGGNDSFSDYLVSYFADRPFTWHSHFSLKTSKVLKEHTRKHFDTTKTYFREILAHENGTTYEPELDYYQPQPKAKRFMGKVYVLVNRQSHSQSTVTAAQIQDYGFGTLVGEETGEFPTLYASQFQFQLPNTGITVNLSKGYSIRVNGSTKAEGVVPDICIKDHLLDEQDEILNGLLAQLQN